MFYYNYEGNTLISECKYNLHQISEEAAQNSYGFVYALSCIPCSKSRRSFCITSPSQIFCKDENIQMINSSYEIPISVPNWILNKINDRKVISLNTSYPSWKQVIKDTLPSGKKSWNITIAGLGDVGGILLTGLRLLGGNLINNIGIYDKDQNKMLRWKLEASQICYPDSSTVLPNVSSVNFDDIFDSDMFVFCISRGVPEIGCSTSDVRMAQLKGNAEIISEYAKKAREKAFKGIFAVVSDPVDLLCKEAFIKSNTNEEGNFDFLGLAPEQIRGYGLGVMNARASFYASQNKETIHYLREGRAYGPHGKGLIIADSIDNYNENISNILTEKTIDANLEVRNTGFKPFIAPAISSGSISLLSTIKGEWHYSSTFLGGTFFGARNRLTYSGVEIETLPLPQKLFNRIKQTYDELSNLL